MNRIILALIGTGFTFFATVLGSAMVFLFKNKISPKTEKAFLGFAAGIMIAASVWSLLIPAQQMAAEQGQNELLCTCAGFILGGAFLFLLDKLLPHMHLNSGEKEGVKSSFAKSTLLVLAVTLHNIPEGMAVGLSFGLSGESKSLTLSAAAALALGIGLQNFPEGAAISLPLKKEGVSSLKAFILGSLSGIVEPVGGVLAVLLAGTAVAAMPWLLSFAAGAMIFVVVEELIPEARLGEHSDAGTLAVMAGFALMMVLDMAFSV
ncbi:MAG: zinc transporter, family [Clostridiales bacterium]|jgi:ZIP family zinc transporter|nr:zinc transporter [Oscillospiraceae bacterium]MDN5378031.1 zinc transporter, family [Clostridiales bacterium]